MICFFFDENFFLILELVGLIKFIRLFFGFVSKVKVVKLVRGLVDMFLDMEVLIGKEVGGRKDFVLSFFFVGLLFIFLIVNF